MEQQVMANTEEYRLLMFQPDPAVGERFCVGLLFQDDVIYDANFAKLKCLSKRFDTSVIRFYLNELRDRLRGSKAIRPGELVSPYAPVLLCSDARRVASPVTAVMKSLLLRRLVMQEPTFHDGDVALQMSSEQQKFSSRLREITPFELRNSFDQVIENAKPKQILGHQDPAIGTVALAFRRLNRTVLVDGVDLNSESPKHALRRSARVVHTFWQYKRAAMPNLFRLAVVLNGHSSSEALARDAHDFVVEHFRLEADRTIEGSSADVSRSMVDLLSS